MTDSSHSVAGAGQEAEGPPTCVECGSSEAVERLGELAPEEPWLVCRPCLDRFAHEALVAELRRRGVAVTVVRDIMDKSRKPQRRAL